MAKIFITGSADGLGSRAAKVLVERGHQVTLHARNAQRAKDAQKACPGAENVLVADLSSTEETKQLAQELNKLGPWDSIIHNAGVMRVSSSTKGKEDLPVLFATNTLAPYMLTCLVKPPKRLTFLSSQMHQGGDPSLRNLTSCGYSDSKLHNTMMAFAFAKKFPNVEVSSLDPGWVQTKMGGAGAPDDIDAAVETYVMLAEGTGAAKGQTGQHWYQSRPRDFAKAAADGDRQEKLLKELESISGVSIPASSNI
ncbi:hypothetical protein H2198_000026 [Neophaeococcomyces mojaviensis]|uniref:Uncharacterized protein n=1 Tax=Neophaeococcomyces mojaviensis TaxID=3383035 RepID=A0ACC3AKR5_9EURO|nr:hypothetical protein H2198_000026 [Knufia sp. JES_112]